MTPNGPQQGMEKRMLLALALMMLVLFGAQYFFKPAPAPKSAAPNQITRKNAGELAQKPQAPPPAAANENPGANQAVAAAAESDTVIDTDVYRIVFTNRGAVVKSWLLKKFQDTTGKKLLDLVNDSKTGIPLPFALDLKGHSLGFDPNQALFVATPSADKLGVAFEYGNGKTVVRKSFHFEQKSYLSKVRSEVVEGSNFIPHVLAWRGGFGDQNEKGAALRQHSLYYNPSSSKLVTKTVKDVKEGPFSETGDYNFGGVEDNFFAAVAMPANSSLEVRTYADDVKVPDEEKPEKFTGAGFASGAQNSLTMFVGPKDTDLLRQIDPKLEKLINWGFFGIIAKPLFLALNWVADHWTLNYGWAIILVTLIINLVLFPLKISQLKSAKKMQTLQPRLKAINEKYKGIGMSDPRKAQQNEETMALYKEAGVNPLGGCLPLLIQLPFLYAFYQVLQIAIEMRGAHWLWVSNLSQPETLALRILPLLLIATQFLSQKMTPATGMDPNQQRVMMFMPLLYGFMFYSASSGLVLYWLTSNLAMIAQQLIINQLSPVPAPNPPVVKAPVSSKAPVKKASK